MATRRTRHSGCPTLDPGITLLHRPSARPRALHEVVVEQLDRTGGRTLWVDARNDASTYALYDRAPDSRVLEGIEIARAFTAYQHHSLVTRLVEEVDPTTELIVVPCTASLYTDDDVRGSVGSSLLDSSMTILGELATTFDVPVLVATPSVDTEAERLVADAADRELTATETDQGLRFEGDGFETTVYWWGEYFQTTIQYWVDLFGCTCTESTRSTEATRSTEPTHSTEPTRSTEPTVGAASVGR